MHAALQGQPSEGSQANGSLMRSSPLGVFAHALPPQQAAELARADSALTHPHPVCGDSVAAYVIAVAHAVAHGDARGAYEAARDYSKQRQAFGKPISDFQAIQFMLADMATEIDAARLLTYRAATIKDEGEKVTQFSAMAKLYASEVAVRATEKGVQIFGGYGFIKEFPAEKYYRDVKLCTIGEGTSEIQRVVIARNLLSDR
jgi:alkylation response protein AidB-like acyl-CoA dehydrogenase